MLQAYFHLKGLEAGIDEAGRGCYAGPVFAAAVILPKNFYHPWLNDSKKLSESRRNHLRYIIENNAVSWSVASSTEAVIDTINILQATYLAMHASVTSLSPRPNLLLVDGKWFKPYEAIPHVCVVKGDGLYTSIAAASVLAKTHRDEYMVQLHRQFPEYDWENNKGYGTLSHRRAIAQQGLCKHHRKSFQILPQQPELF